MASRLLWLHLRSRRAPLALLLITATGALLRLLQPWTTGSGESAELLPPVLAVGAAAVIATSMTSPFGEPERATYPLPWLRLAQVTALLLAGAALLGLARLGHDPLAAIRNLAGFAGMAMLTATVISAPMSWIVPLAYAIYCGGPIDIHAPSLWSWPALPSSNHAATGIALAILGAGVLGITYAGTRERHCDPG
ncbi:MAG: hypothetical protein JO242_10275 [Streptosporangiaceae bacterium]|nr:hypothetical protein [Streptosporangiaceae bacterium]